ncbi:coiled-coil domain-containing protein 142 isoform X2 [Rhinoderma darwinii]|uniref:coiled-coil domain-containing protein 142 isoform X2 n=1 Tax=Rhinoderma darwinii TaxID=43563 RepID=UPI003F66FDF7
MRRRAAHWSDDRRGVQQGSSPCSPVFLHHDQLRCDVISEGEELTHTLAGRHVASLLLFYRRQRHLLTLAREFVVHQTRVLEYHETVEQTSLSGLEAVCFRLLELYHAGASLQRRVLANQLLRPLFPPVHRTLGNMHRTLQHMTVKAAIVTEALILSAVRRAACLPAVAPGSLCRALSVYNKVIAEVLPWAVPLTDVQPMSITRSLKIMAEERAWLLGGSFSQAGLRHWLQDVLMREEVESWEVGGVLLSHLETLIQEDKRQVAPLLRVLSGLEVRSSCTAESVLYEQYCSLLWPLLCAHLFQALYPGRRGVQSLPALTPCAMGWRTAAVIQLLHGVLTSDAVPEQCREMGRSLCQHLLCTGAFISWDRGVCRALSSALTDKCVTPLDDGSRRTHSRTSSALVTVCQELSVVLDALTSGRTSLGLCIGAGVTRSPVPAGDVSSHQGVLSRCVMSLQLCELWLRSRAQIYIGSVSHLLLISHGDLPAIRDQMRSVTAATRKVEWTPVSQRLCATLQNVADSLEGAASCLPRLLRSVCARQAQDIFQHLMPVGRHWRGKVASGEFHGGPDLVPSDYSRAAVNAVLVPLLEGVSPLSLEEQMAAVSVTIVVFMEAWMEHILRERMRFRERSSSDVTLRVSVSC